jgi:hypothetical protein
MDTGTTPPLGLRCRHGGGPDPRWAVPCRSLFQPRRVIRTAAGRLFENFEEGQQLRLHCDGGVEHGAAVNGLDKCAMAGFSTKRLTAVTQPRSRHDFPGYC